VNKLTFCYRLYLNAGRQHGVDWVNMCTKFLQEDVSETDADADPTSLWNKEDRSDMKLAVY